MPTLQKALAAICIALSVTAHAQTSISAASTTTISTASGTTYTTTGAVGSGLAGNTYEYRYGANSGTTANKVFLNNFTAGGSTYFFDYGMNITVNLNRVNNANVTGTRDLIYNEATVDATPNPDRLNINAPYVPSMSTIFIGNDDLRSGTDNLFGNTNNADGNFNNIERVDVRLNGNTGFTVGDPTREGFAIFDRGAAGGHDPFVVSVITTLDGSGNPSAYTTVQRATSATYGATNPVGNTNYVVLRRDGGAGNLLASVIVNTQGTGGVFYTFSSFGITAGTRIYGYSLSGSDFPVAATGADMVNFSNATNFPINSDAAGAGGIDLSAITGVFKIFNDDLDNAVNDVDLDDDNDGIPDTIENGGNNPYGDADGDGMQNYVDPTPGTGLPAFVDQNGDDINDAYDADKDGHVNQIDLDSDNDGIPDIVEAGGVDTNGNGFIDGGVADSDGDGLMNAYDASSGGVSIANLDTDGDGIRNFLDLDSDNDGISDIVETGGVDANGDGRVDNFLDTDSDGFDDTIDGDAGNDGVAENTSRALLVTGTDGNGDGRPDSYPQGIANTDGRSLPNAFDLDSDNDGIPDVIEALGIDADNNGRADGFTDTDGDGFADTRDGDVGNDGTAENTANVLIITGPDADDNGRPDSYPRANADGAGVPNAYDLDSDQDGIPDLIEAGGIDSNGDGRVDDLIDTDNNGWQNTYDPTQGGINIRFLDANGAAAGGGVFDFDGDGIANYLDLDSDNDGIPDLLEQGGTDSNNDGKLDGTTDSDNDGFIDTVDPINNSTGAAIPGAVILISTSTIGANNLPTVYSAGDNGDRTGLINMLDLDSDDDGILDVREAGITDAGFDGIADGTLGTDGWSDTVDGLASLNPANTDGRGPANYLDIDSDDDGLTDNIEAQTTSSYLLPASTDTDADGINNAYDNNDGLFAGGNNNGLSPNNHDGLDLPDYIDSDSDNDGVNDLREGSGNNTLTITNTADADSDGLLDQFDTFNLNSITSNIQNNVTSSGMGASGSTSGPSPAGSSSTAFQTNAGSLNRDFRNGQFVLPLKLNSFDASVIENKVLLSWQTSNEVGFDHFQIERSLDGINFISLGKINGKGGDLNTYSFTDLIQHTTVSSYYYRLRLNDQDGSFSFSSIKKIKVDEAAFSVAPFSNIIENDLRLRVSISGTEKLIISLVSSSGQIVKQTFVSANTGDHQIHLNRPASRGWFLLIVEAGKDKKTYRVFVP